MSLHENCHLITELKMIKYFDFIHRIRDRYAKHVGRIVFLFNHLENDISCIILMPLLGVTETKRNILASSLSFQQKCDVAVALCKNFLRYEEDVLFCESLFRKCIDLHNYRNYLLHAKWAIVSPDFGAPFMRLQKSTIKARKGFRHFDEIPRIATLIKRQDEFCAAQNDIMILGALIDSRIKGSDRKLESFLSSALYRRTKKPTEIYNYDRTILAKEYLKRRRVNAQSE